MKTSVAVVNQVIFV